MNLLSISGVFIKLYMSGEQKNVKPAKTVHTPYQVPKPMSYVALYEHTPIKLIWAVEVPFDLA